MTKAQFTYKVGDRVAERPKTHGILTTNSSTRERIAKYRTQRYGTVLGSKEKKDRGGRTVKLLVIQWDHLKSPMEHAQFRICHERDLPTMMKNAMVPGE
jgi:hypothetical protein